MAVPTPDNIQIPMSIWGPIFTAIGGLATGAMFVWKKFSSQKLETTKNNAETDVIEHLQEQRDEAIKTAKEAQQARAISELALAEAKARMEEMADNIESLRQRLALLNQLVGRLTAALDLTKQQLTSIIRADTTAKILLTNNALSHIDDNGVIDFSPGADGVLTISAEIQND